VKSPGQQALDDHARWLVSGGTFGKPIASIRSLPDEIGSRFGNKIIADADGKESRQTWSTSVVMIDGWFAWRPQIGSGR